MKKQAKCKNVQMTSVLVKGNDYLVENNRYIGTLYDVYDLNNPNKYIDSYKKERFQLLSA